MTKHHSALRLPMLFAITLGSLIAAPISGLKAQSIAIEDPDNDFDTRPGDTLDVGGTYSFTSGQATNIRLRMWEVDSNDNSVGDAKKDEPLNVSAATPGSWGIGIDVPMGQAQGTVKRYKITAQLRNGTTPVATSTIFVNSYASGGP